MKFLHLVFTTTVVLFANNYAFSQNSVGIGTENSNDHAVLELVSPTNNQGFLVPRLTTAQRTNTSFINSLSTSDNGLLVFDSQQKIFYFWHDNDWQQVKSGPEFTAGTGISINNGQIINTGDTDPSNEIQNLSLAGNTLTITNNPSATSIDLSPFSGTNTDNQTLSFSAGSLSITGGNSVDISSLYAAGSGISLAGGVITNTGDTDASDDFSGSFNDLTNVPPNLDTDFTDDFDGNFSSLKGIPAGIADGDDINDADADPTNEIQDLTLSSNTLSLSGDATTVDLSGFANTDNQNLSSSASGNNRTINISGGTGTTFSIADNDNNSNNEIQTLARTGNDLSISGGNSVTINDQIAFKAVMENNQTINNGNSQLIFGNTEYDLKGNYDLGSSTFKVPIDGVYNFSGVITLLVDTGSESQLFVVVDGAPAHVINIKSTYNTDSFPFSVDLSLTAGQSVALFIGALKSGNAIGNGAGKNPNESYWSGKLLVNLSK